MTFVVTVGRDEDGAFVAECRASRDPEALEHMTQT